MKFTIAITCLTNLATGQIVCGAPHATNNNVIARSRYTSQKCGRGTNNDAFNGATNKVTNLSAVHDSTVNIERLFDIDMQGNPPGQREFNRKNRGQNSRYTSDEFILSEGYQFPGKRNTIKASTPNQVTPSSPPPSNRFSPLSLYDLTELEGAGASEDLQQDIKMNQDQLNQLLRSLEDLTTTVASLGATVESVQNDVSILKQESPAKSEQPPALATTDASVGKSTKQGSPLQPQTAAKGDEEKSDVRQGIDDCKQPTTTHAQGDDKGHLSQRKRIGTDDFDSKVNESSSQPKRIGLNTVESPQTPQSDNNVGGYSHSNASMTMERDHDVSGNEDEDDGRSIASRDQGKHDEPWFIDPYTVSLPLGIILCAPHACTLEDLVNGFRDEAFQWHNHDCIDIPYTDNSKGMTLKDIVAIQLPNGRQTPLLSNDPQMHKSNRAKSHPGRQHQHSQYEVYPQSAPGLLPINRAHGKEQTFRKDTHHTLNLSPYVSSRSHDDGHRNIQNASNYHSTAPGDYMDLQAPDPSYHPNQGMRPRNIDFIHERHTDMGSRSHTPMMNGSPGGVDNGVQFSLGQQIGNSYQTVRRVTNQFELDQYSALICISPLFTRQLKSSVQRHLIGSVRGGTIACGVWELQDDFLEQTLGFDNPMMRETMMNQHAVVQQRGMDSSTGRLIGPLLSRAFAYLDLPQMTDWSEYEFVDLWTTLSIKLPTYQMCLISFDAYQLDYDRYQLAVPGLGLTRTRDIDQALFKVLFNEFTGSSERSKHGRLWNVINMVQNSTQSGFQLLIDIGIHVVGALDTTKLLERPECNGDIFDFANKLRTHFILQEKRGTKMSVKDKALIFLQGCSETVDTSMMLMTIRSVPDSIVPPTGWDINQLAQQITLAPTSTSPTHTVMRVGAPPGGNRVSDEYWIGGLSNSVEDSMLQGYSARVNKANKEANPLKKRNRVPTDKPFPEPFPNRRIDRRANEGKKCEACGKPNHTASHCFALAQAAYIHKFMKEGRGRNRETVLEAMKHWDDRWKSRSESKYRSVKLVNLLDEFSSDTGISTEDICNQLAWDTFYPPDDFEMMWANEDEED